MTVHDKRATERVAVALRIRLRYQAVDQFISKFAINISRGGMFLSSRNPKPPGTELYFEIRLADDSPIIEGTGQVRWIREYDRTRPGEPHGMGIQFVELSDTSGPLLDRVIEHRRAIGEIDDDSIPVPRATMLGVGPPVPIAPAAARPAPASEAEPVPPLSAVSALSEPGDGPGEKPGEKADDGAREPDERLRGEILRALAAPEPSRGRARPATRPPDPDMVRTAVARARAITRGGPEQMDAELAELLEESAVPVAITVDAASRELAERLGGNPVERSGPYEAPPAARERQNEPRSHEAREAECEERRDPGRPASEDVADGSRLRVAE
jgi:uncharacterized protein (TIGR02266 family)